MIATIVAGFLAANTIVLSWSLVRLNSLLMKYRYIPAAVVPESLPTVSVCIPARNETHAMTECLERVLASDYKKLEVIVLDDSSVDDTSMLIKSFAHAGVRFVEGSPLPDDWLGKNHALEGLLKESSSKYILFLCVDTMVQSHTITNLVAWAQEHDQPFVSILPQRVDGRRASMFFGTLRYFWTLLQDSNKTPAVSSASWLVDRQKLIDAGGFSPYKSITQPEMRLARKIRSVSEPQLILSDIRLGVSYEKKWKSQVETSVRLLEPLFESSVKTVAMSTAFLLVAILPLGAFVWGLFFSKDSVAILAGVNLLLISLISLCYFKAMWRSGWWLSLIHWPLIVIQEAILMMVSVLRYTRGTVTWKARSVATSPKR